MPQITIIEQPISKADDKIAALPTAPTERMITVAPTAPTTPTIKLPEKAWRGSFKDYRDLVSGTTEAADAFHFAAYLQVFGCTLGRSICVYHAGRLFPNFYTCLVGRSGLTRKDTTVSRGRLVLDALHAYPEDLNNPPFKVIRGLRSYEGLLDELAGERKVRLVQLGELLSLLAKAKQDSVGNLIPALTELYDSPDILNPAVHQKEVKPAKEPFLSIIAGTTQDWLQKALSEKDIYGGFSGRWLYFCGLPKEPMDNPSPVLQKELNAVVEHLNIVRNWADDRDNPEIPLSDEARLVFKQYYCDYYRRCQQPGLIPTLIVRIQDFIFKIALIFAADDQSEIIRVDHMEAAIAVGHYLEGSVAEVFANFGSSNGKILENKVLDYLRNFSKPVQQRDVYYHLHMEAKQLRDVIIPLIKIGLVRETHTLNNSYDTINRYCHDTVTTLSYILSLHCHDYR